MHSRDATVLIDLLWFNVVHYSSLFQYFFWSTKIPNFLMHLFVNFFQFGNTIFMIEIQYRDPGGSMEPHFWETLNITW